MRVMHVVATGERRGAEVFASDLVRALGRSGIEQRVAVLRRSVGKAVEFDAPTSLLDDGSRGRMNSRTLRSLRALVRRWKPDIVQAHGGEALKYSVPSCLGIKSQVVYRRIGATPDSVAGSFRRAAYGALARRASQVVAVSNAGRRETVEAFRVSPERIAVIPNGVDVSRTAPKQSRLETRQALGIPAAAPMMISVGALTWEKDPVAHVEIGARVLARLPDAVHAIAGRGPVREQVEEAVDRLGLVGRVLLLGDRTDVADLLAASDVMLLASRTEGMPACLIEAGMAGVPVAAYSVGGVAEVVAAGETGFLAFPGDQEGLAAAVTKLFIHGEARRAMGAAARQWCLSRFEIRPIAQLYLKIYGGLTAPDPKASS
jgi:glycosyltransferase involved in cell wall biosynthesis